MLSNLSERPQMMTPSSAVAEKLRKDIRNGNYSLGQKLASEHELANHLGVNRTTIRKALKILQEERLIARQQGHGTFVTNSSYARTVGTQVALIGAMVWEKEYYFGTILNGAFSRSASRGYVLTTASNTNEEVETYNTEVLINSKVQGLVLTPRQYSLNSYKRFVSANIPVVMLDSILPGVKEDFVSVNNQQGSEMVTEHLIELGHTRIAYIGGIDPNDVPCRPDRLAGFLNACAQYNIKVPQDWYTGIPYEDHAPWLRTLLGQADRPTAIVAYSDVWALRVIKVAQELGLKVPDDLSVTGFDNSELSRNGDIPLTSISPEPTELGTIITDFLIEKIENPQSRSKRSILITPRLITRASTAKPL
jgi:GntR family transcriptional regulator, arabinose operon transcriptional repressor